MNFYMAVGRVKHILEDWENSTTVISTDFVLSAYFLAALFVNSIIASGKKNTGAEAPITVLRDDMDKIMDDLIGLNLDDNTVLDGNCDGIGILHYILHLDDGAGSVRDARKIDAAADAKKTEFQNFGRCKANKRRLAADRAAVEKCLKDCKAYNMIANVQKIRMFTAMRAKTGITWGRVASENYAFFLMSSVDERTSGCFKHLQTLDKSSAEGQVIVGRGELIFYRKTYPSAALEGLSDKLNAESKIGERPERAGLNKKKAGRK